MSTHSPKLEDLARLCQVNKGTVSRALNNKKGVSEKKREDIIRIAKNIGFQPNAFASALAGGLKYSILIIFQDFELLNNEYYGKLYLNLVRLLNHAGYALTTGTLEGNQYRKIIQQNQVDGVILLNSSKYQEVLETCKTHQIALIGIGTGFQKFATTDGKLETPIIAVDNITAGKNAAAFLHSKKANNLLFFSAKGIQSFTERLQGFEDYTKENRLSLTTHFLATQSYNSHLYVKDAFELIRQLNISDFSNIGIFCANDDIGLGIYKFFEKHYQQLPCPLLCFDNSFIAEHTGEGFSSFEQNIEQIALEGTQKLLSLVNNSTEKWQPKEIHFLEAKIIERNSTKQFQPHLMKAKHA